MSIRETAAVIGLVVFATLILTVAPISEAGTTDRAALAMWGLLPALGLTLAGVIRQAAWARWLALGGAIAVLPWALVLTIAPLGLPVGRQVIALAASLAIFTGLARPTGLAPGATGAPDRASRLRELVGWTIAANVASLLVLYLFAVALEYRTGWHLAVMCGLVTLLLFGIVALGRGRTAGVLAIALFSVGLLATGGAFLVPRAGHAGEVLLLGAVFLPGLVMGGTLLCALARPMGRVLRGGVPDRAAERDDARDPPASDSPM